MKADQRNLTGLFSCNNFFSSSEKLEGVAGTSNDRYCKGDYNGASSYFPYNENKDKSFVYTCYKVATNERIVINCKFYKTYFGMYNQYDKNVNKSSTIANDYHYVVW